MGQDYKRAYERQKLAREKAETLLEERSRELYAANETLKEAYNSLQEQKNQLVQQEKLASIGLLAAGVAHEINNPVGFVKSNLQTLKDYTRSYSAVLNSYKALVLSLKENDSSAVNDKLKSLDQLLQQTELDFIAQDGVDCIMESLSGIQRIEEIIINLSDFARSEDDDSRVLCDINELIDNTIKLVWNEIKYKVEIEKDYGSLPEIYGSPGQLRQVFVNIIVNAAQAIDSNGILSISTKEKNDLVCVIFRDDGPGMEEETLNKLFDPFFTTKEVGSGTGLGLYVSHGIIKNHHGTLIAENNPEGGACFSISLPIEARKQR